VMENVTHTFPNAYYHEYTVDAESAGVVEDERTMVVSCLHIIKRTDTTCNSTGNIYHLNSYLYRDSEDNSVHMKACNMDQPYSTYNLGVDHIWFLMHIL